MIPSQTSTDGVVLLLGINRLNSRCLFIGDSAKLTQNVTNSVIALNPTGRFDCTSTDGAARLPAVFNGAIFTDATYNTTLISSLNVSGVTTLSNATTCMSSLNVSGVTVFSNWVGIGTTPTSVLELFKPFYATFKLNLVDFIHLIEYIVMVHLDFYHHIHTLIQTL